MTNNIETTVANRWKNIDDCAVNDWIEYNSRYCPDKMAVLDIYSNRRRTYKELHERVGRIAGMLVGKGVSRGDRIGVLSQNSSDMIEIQFACWRIGVIYVPFNFRLTSTELSYIINDASPSVVIFDNTYLDLVDDLRGNCGNCHWIDMDGKGVKSSFEDHIVKASPIYKMLEQKPSDLCMIMYSSGTTGVPKGVMFNYAMIIGHVTNAAPAIRASYDMVGLTAMPLFHIAGNAAFSLTTIYFGATSVIVRSFDPEQVLDLINDCDLAVTHFMGVPAIFNALKAHPNNAATDFSRMRFAMAGAETIPLELLNWWRDRGMSIQELYGMTESGGIVCILSPHDVVRKVGSAGQPLRHCQMKIAREDGSEASPGELGEIHLRGVTITPGYWNRPDATDDSFVDGWFRSGDIGKKDSDGYIYIEDRLKDMYISGGENVYPAEIENVLYGIDGIVEMTVIGVPHERWGEVGCVVAVIRDGFDINIESIKSICEGKLAKYKHPMHIVTIDSLPRNPSGKVQKFKLRELVKNTTMHS